MNKKTVLVSAVLLCFMGLAHAQQTTTAAGGTATGAGGTATYSVGQVIYTSNSGTTGSVAQGVQQPFDVSVISAIKGSEGITLHCVAYPNPTTDILILQIDTELDAQFMATLSDATGKELVRKPITDSKTQFEMSQYAAASYYLQVSNAAGTVKQFKIVKP